MRTEKALKNIITSIGCYLLILVLGLIIRRLLLQEFDLEFVGYDALLSNIFGLIGIAEIGTDRILGYRLYEAFAKEDHPYISKLLSMYRAAYFCIAGVIAVLCTLLFFFLPVFFGEKVSDWGSFRLMYVLYALGTVASYLYGYWRTMLFAAQMEHKTIQTETAIQTLGMVVRVLVLSTIRSYPLYLVLTTAFTLIGGLRIAHVSKKQFQDIRIQKVSFSDYKEERFLEEVRDLLVIKVSTAANNATDSLLITMLIDVKTAALYSNYLLIGTHATNLIYKLIFPLAPSVANLVYKEPKEESLRFYRTMDLLCFFLSAVILSGFIVVFQNAISVFFGSQYHLPMSFVVCYAVLGYMRVKSQVTGTYHTCFGEFKIEKVYSIWGAILNIAASIVFLHYWGITGIIIGTLVAVAATWHGNFVITEKRLFQRNIGTLWLHEAAELLLAGMEAGAAWLIALSIPYTVGGMFLRCVISVAVPTMINLLIFWRSDAFQDIVMRIQRIILNRRQPPAES